MKIFFLVIGIIILIIILASVIYIHFYNKVNEYIIRITEAENRIDKNLHNKFELLDKSFSTIKGIVKLEDSTIDDIIKFRARRINNYDLNKSLMDLYSKFLSLFQNNLELQDNLELSKNFKQLALIEEELLTLRNYHDNNAEAYNELIKKIPTNIISKINNWKQEELYKIDTE